MMRSPAGAARACLPFLVTTLITACPNAAAQVLPDSAVLARVGDRTITVYDFRDRYFSSEGQTRPRSDSTGRVTFLNTMVDKDVLGLTAVGLGQPLQLEDRLTMREFESNELARLYYRRRVLDSVVVTEKDLKRVFPQYSRQLKLRYLLLDRLDMAEKLRADLVHGRIAWKEAARRYSLAPDSLIHGDLGWVERSKLTGRTAIEVFDLQPTGISEVLPAEDGYRIWQCIGRRTVGGPAYNAIRGILLEDLKAVATGPRAEKFYAEMRARADARFDTANIVWLADQFLAANRHLFGALSDRAIDLRSTRAPRISAADTGRVLIVTRRGPLSVDRVLTEYRAAPSLTRTRIYSYSSLFGVVQRMALQPDIADAAREQGYDRDPAFLAEIARARESLQVERMYADSVETRVRVTEAQRKSYYEQHRREMVTRERVRYAVFQRVTEAGADSLIARLDAGASPFEISRDDSLHGLANGQVRYLSEGEPHDYRALLFEELKSGQSTKVGPSRDSSWIVFHVLTHEDSRPMSYAEVLNIVDESVQNLESERLLRALLDRLRERYAIEVHPELVMRVALMDPAGDWNVPSGD